MKQKSSYQNENHKNSYQHNFKKLALVETAINNKHRNNMYIETIYLLDCE